MKFVLPRRRALILSGGALAAPMLASGIARAADDWPSKPVKYINSFPAGGPTDALSRIVCQKLSELSGQQFIVENRGGSGGNVGADAIAHSPPDGYTIGLLSVSSHAIAPSLYAKLPFNADKDFTPVTMLWSLPNLLVVRKSLGPKTVPELIALAKEKPGKLSYASSGSGTTVHLSGALFVSMAKIDILHVPYRGSAPAVQDLLADQVDMIFDNIPGSLAQMGGGKVWGLAVTGTERSPMAPDVPAMAEFLPGYDINSWGGICGPAGLPPAMVEKLNALTKQALDSDDVKKAYLKNGATPLWKSVADTVAYRRSEEARFAPIVKASGAKVD
ncbi:Tripartite-type tricarboxylate transporter, receptor component TctC [Enhydrobacter aerosaccus]|uniref:Tripartite-type tricarboxylate transporter, receptor component TctC n=1 Tax=Enhydrobacter aerosaccus TaxID=225324 RepID=A0A1T4RLK0_9HYPH|nr:tripartite tricarboxylate transporter substrate binding protein [Enhydrobacter aerosaccus]SKA16561.1 Tripartite-type tricarboxylate transporter, receptor component TctC [Enhydrobacter aerosaccus]